MLCTEHRPNLCDRTDYGNVVGVEKLGTKPGVFVKNRSPPGYVYAIELGMLSPFHALFCRMIRPMESITVVGFPPAPPVATQSVTCDVGPLTTC